MQRLPIGKLKPNPANPRLIKDEKFKKLVASIKSLPEMLELRPIVVNADLMVLGGNMRLKACQAAGLREVPVIIADQLTDAQQAEFVIKDNVSFGEWEWDALADTWDAGDLNAWGLDVPVWPQEEHSESAIREAVERGLTEYSKKIKAPIYEPKNEKPSVDSLVDNMKAQALLNEIEAADISNDERTFLRQAAARHLVFNYELIADYYAHAPKNTQRIMEALALVIVDFGKAIEHGFVALSGEIIEQYKKDQHSDIVN